MASLARISLATRLLLTWGCVVWLGAIGVRSGHAHEVELSSFRTTFFEDGSVQVDVTFDADAFLVDAISGHTSEDVRKGLLNLTPEGIETRIAALRRLFEIRVRLRFDGEVVRQKVVFPRLGEGRRGAATPQEFPGDLVRLTCEVPEGARSFVFWASRSFGTVTLDLMRDGEDPIRQVLQVADRSEPFFFRQSVGKSSLLSVVREYTWLGFLHILPKGLDHILFILGLFLLSARLKPLLFQVTAFTVAHSVTLALAMFDVVRLPASIVEPLIALSISYVAIENLFTSTLKPWRPTVVFGFGLLHGLGFAGVLRELGLPARDFAGALIGFNIGVEAGQLAVIAMGIAAIGWWRTRKWYRRMMVIPASCIIAIIGLYWAVERVLG